MTRRFLFRWSVIATLVIPTLIGFGIYLGNQPSELEYSIRGDLTLKSLIDDESKMTILEYVQRFNARSARVEFAIVCIQDESEYHLAHLVHNAYGTWRSRRASWKSFDEWPTPEQVKEFSAQFDGLWPTYRIRPPDQIDFRAKRLVIRIQQPVGGFDPNEGVDGDHFASLMLDDCYQVADFALTPFDQPTWFAASAGLRAIRRPIEIRESRLKYGDERPPLERDLEVLRAIESRLEEIERRGLKFHFMAI